MQIGNEYTDGIEPATEGQFLNSNVDVNFTVNEEPLVIKCESAVCIFELCRRHMSRQMLLLHYLSEHSNFFNGSLHSKRINEGGSAVFSFHPRYCRFQQIQVLGLLAYSENIFLPVYVRTAVLLCKVTLGTNLRMHEQEPPHMYVIWLVTPDCTVNINASLLLEGRDAALKVRKTVSVRQLADSQPIEKFLTVDNNCWRLSARDIQKLTNTSRDELNLAVSLSNS